VKFRFICSHCRRRITPCACGHGLPHPKYFNVAHAMEFCSAKCSLDAHERGYQRAVA